MEKDNKEERVEMAAEEDFESLLDQSMADPIHLSPGQEVEAIVTQVTKDWIFIDVGGKTDGYIVINEFMDDEGNTSIKEGDTIKAFFSVF